MSHSVFNFQSRSSACSTLSKNTTTSTFTNHGRTLGITARKTTRTSQSLTAWRTFSSCPNLQASGALTPGSVCWTILQTGNRSWETAATPGFGRPQGNTVERDTRSLTLQLNQITMLQEKCVSEWIQMGNGAILPVLIKTSLSALLVSKNNNLRSFVLDQGCPKWSPQSKYCP